MNIDGIFMLKTMLIVFKTIVFSRLFPLAAVKRISIFVE